MGVRARIEHHAVIVGAAGMDLVNQRALVVALVKIHLHALALAISGQLPVNILQGLGTVHILFANTGQVQIWAVHHKNFFHFLTSVKKKRERNDTLPQIICSLFVLSFTSSLALLFAGNRGLLIMLSFADFLDDTVTRSLTLKATQCAVKRFVLFNSNLAH
jgi:hypothetical protein